MGKSQLRATDVCVCVCVCAGVSACVCACVCMCLRVWYLQRVQPGLHLDGLGLAMHWEHKLAGELSAAITVCKRARTFNRVASFDNPALLFFSRSSDA